MRPEEDISKELKEISEADVFNTGKKNLFETPRGYFEGLPDAIMNTMRKQDDGISSPEEIQRISPVLAALKNKETFSAPVDYFDTFSDTILQKVIKPEAVHIAPVISLHRKQAWTRYAAAAVVIGFIAISAIFMFNSKTPAAFTRSDMASQKTNKTIDTNGFYEVSDGALSNYLSTAPGKQESAVDSADAEFYNIALLNIEDKDLADIIHQIPDEDLMSYEDGRALTSSSL